MESAQILTQRHRSGRGRPKIHSHWVARVRQMLIRRPAPSARKIAIDLAAEYRTQGPPPILGVGEPPKERSVRRLRDEFEALSPAERSLYEGARWPESFMPKGPGLEADLPWDAAGATVELIGHLTLRSTPPERLRPTIRSAWWFWRVRQASPSVPAEWAWYLAAMLALDEILGADGPQVVERRRQLEEWLALKGWDRTGLYWEAVSNGRIRHPRELRELSPVPIGSIEARLLYTTELHRWDDGSSLAERETQDESPS